MSIYAGWSGAHGRAHLLLLDEALLLHSRTSNCVYPRVPSWIRHWTAADVPADQSETAMEARRHIPGYMEGTSPGCAMCPAVCPATDGTVLNMHFSHVN